MSVTDIQTITLDSFSTVVDHRAAATALEGHVADPAAVAATWRERSLTYTGMANYLDDYEPFRAMLGHALAYALAAHEEDLPDGLRDEVRDTYLSLPVFDDVEPAIERLTEAGYAVYVLSNGDPELLHAMVAHAGIEGLLTDVISADEVGTYKIHPEIYRHAAARTGTPATEVAHASAGWFDAVGAQNVGMTGVWVNRDEAPPETWGPRPAVTVGSFHELADAFV